MLIDLTARDFTAAVASDSPAPGGGSVAAYAGACGAALLAMVCRLSRCGGGPGDTPMDQLLALAEKKRSELEKLVDEDTAAFNRVMDALRLPKETPGEKSKRREALTEANFLAAGVPLRTAAVCAGLLAKVSWLMEEGNQNALSDAAVALECLHAACRGACYNVRINLGGLVPSEKKGSLVQEINNIETQAEKYYRQAREMLTQKGL
ncbi:cyclodeaminase/cyclohydrolase family protein [Desulfotomaculum copahuensis]|nr:cyclodeaminase/cyclohydrolase family protein [Desulfotomaculum copahuensis]